MPQLNDRQPEGILLLKKQKGKTSFSLVARLRRLLNVQKIGHAGTLDPFATGVMVMLVGRNYTRISDQLLCADKEYLAQLYLGISTDSYDCDGQVTSQSNCIPTHQDIANAIAKFQGEIEQVPPMFSAKKVNGQKLYDMARKGKTIERKPAIVKVETHLLSYDYPYVNIKVACSKGTYIRSIAHDLGILLKCGAHLSALERTRSGSYKIADCLDSELLFADNPDVSMICSRLNIA